MLSDLSTLTQQRTSKLSEQNNIKQEILRLSSLTGVEYLRESYEKDFERLRLELLELEGKIHLYKEKTAQKLKILDQDEFLEQMQKIPDFIRQTTDMKVLDQTLRKIFLNFYVNRKDITKTTLNPPFDVLFAKKVPTSASERT